MPGLPIGFVIASDIINAALIFYVKGKTLSQTSEERPTLTMFRSKQKMFPSGKSFQISEPIQGGFMGDVPGFYAGYTQDNQLQFTQAQNILRAVYTGYETHAGLGITWTELKEDGISVTDNNKMSEHSDRAATVLTDIMQNRLEDFGESWQRAENFTLWKDGSQDPLVPPGILSILTDNPTVGTTGGLNRQTYPWWQHRVNLTLTVSAENQTLTRFLRADQRQLRRYGGKPDYLACGSKFIDALELEVGAKGIYTQEGFKNDGNTDIGMADISMRGVGKFKYDPTLDDLGLSNRCYMMDTRRLKMRPMTGEDKKIVTPERPYNYMVFFRSITSTFAVTMTQLNSSAVYAVTI
jgi:hypothetical protein